MPEEVAIVANQTIPSQRSRSFRSHLLIEALENRQLLSSGLGGSFAGVLPTDLPPGGINHATIRVTNPQGQVEAGKLSVTLFLSDAPSVDSSAFVLGTATRQVHLRGSQTVAFPFRFASPSSVSMGSDYLVAQINGPVTSDGSANETIVVAPKVVAVNQPSVDLAGRIAAFPATLLVNSQSPTTAVAEVQVSNIGNVAARGDLQITMYASTDGAIDSNATMIGTSSFAGVTIRAGGSKMFATKMSLPAGMNPGSYTLLALINPSNAITETNTANNIAVGQHPLRLLSAPAGSSIGNQHHNDNGNNGDDGGGASEVDVEVDTGTDNGCDDGASDTSTDSGGGNASTQASSGDDSSGSDDSGSDFGGPSPVDSDAGSDF